MTLTEQNEIIGKFMDISDKHIQKCYISYDFDWAMLMPVVEKLESMGFAIHIDEDRVFLHFPNDEKEMMDFTKEKFGSKIATVYQAVCAGVEWVLDKTAKAL